MTSSREMIFIILGLLTVGIVVTGITIGTQSAKKESGDPPLTGTSFEGTTYDKDGNVVKATPIVRITRSADEWKELLSDEQFRVLRDKGTERAFSGALLENKQKGVYTCAGCGLPLFTSETKFKSGTGWPSFFDALGGNVYTATDNSHGMTRDEILCSRCGGHLGHVFGDGPAPTGLRYCVNSVSLGFVPEEKIGEAVSAVKATPPLQSAVFAGGCFWCVEAVFEELEGVHEAVSGYTGGTRATANYKDVSSGRTGHAEAVKILYDPSKIDFATLLQVHFATHDPTTLNRQGNDRGPHYRSAIFFATQEEKELAEAMIEDLNEADVFADPIVTTLEPLYGFYEAEAYHQNYVCTNPSAGYVRGVAMPKVDKVRKKFKSRLKDQSPLDENKKADG